jgi:DNA repair protein RadC
VGYAPTMVPTTFSIRIRSLFRPRRFRMTGHPDSVSEASLNLPRRIDDPTSAAQLTRDLLRNHREDITTALYLDDRHRRYGAPSATEGEDRSFRTIAAACSRYGAVVADHVIVTG